MCWPFPILCPILPHQLKAHGIRWPRSNKHRSKFGHFLPRSWRIQHASAFLDEENALAMKLAQVHQSRRRWGQNWAKLMVKHLLLVMIAVCFSLPAVAQQKSDPAPAPLPPPVRTFTPQDFQNPPPKPEHQGIPINPQDVNCKANWNAKGYRPFESIQSEIRERYGDVKVLRVSLCGEGDVVFFQIVIITGQGAVSRVQVVASK
jgi:hypothetical protein